jgi:murein DD-endopeptidase MepM/ murein hydrolase activator NlpD
MITTITGVRQSKIANSRVDRKFKVGLNKKNGKKTTFANKKANIDNDCEYQFFSPFLDESDNKSLYKSVNMEQLSNWKPDWLNESGTDRRSSEDNAQYANVREAILCTLYGECIGEEKLGWQLAASVMYSQIHLHSEGLKTVLHRYRFEAFGKKEWSEVSGNTSFIETVEEIFEKSPSILVGEETEVLNPVIIYNGGVKSNLTSSNHKITLAELQQLSGYVARDYYSDAKKRLTEDNNCLLAHFYFQHKGHVFHSHTTEKDFNKNTTYWEINKTNNANNDSKITISKTDEEKNLSDLQVGIYRALKNTLSKAESFANNEVILESGDTNFMLLKAKDETKTHLIFDALLNTYYEYIDGLFWVSEKNNTTIDYPKNVWVSVHKPVIVSRSVVQTYVENGEYKTLTDFNGSLSENFKKSISKKYFPNDTNIKNFIINDNGQAKIFKKECVNFVKDESSTTEEYATLMSEVFNKVNILDCPTEPQNESSKADNAAFSDTLFKSEGVVNDTPALTEISTPLDKEIGFVVTSPWFNQRQNPETGEVRPHRGVDLAYVGNKIEGIFSLYNGTVIAVRPMKGYGNIILIAHDIFKTVGGKQKILISLYAHMKGSTILVKASDKVKKGQKIATIGNEGIGTGPHLHLETCWLDRDTIWAISLFDITFKSNLVNPETVIVLNSKNNNFGKYIG